MYFFLSNDFDIITASPKKLFETTVGALAEGKLGSFTVPRGVIPFSQVPNVYLRTFSQKAQKRGEDTLVSFPLRREDYLPCSVAMVEHEEITGLLLFADDEGQEGFSMVYRYVLGRGFPPGGRHGLRQCPCHGEAAPLRNPGAADDDGQDFPNHSRHLRVPG